jgi:outer membrane biosynthesis protein TonB
VFGIIVISCEHQEFFSPVSGQEQSKSNAIVEGDDNNLDGNETEAPVQDTQTEQAPQAQTEQAPQAQDLQQEEGNVIKEFSQDCQMIVTCSLI